MTDRFSAALTLALIMTQASAFAQDAGQEKTPRAELTQEDRLLASMLSWEFDGRCRFGPELWRERGLVEPEALARMRNQIGMPLPAGGVELLTLALQQQAKDLRLTIIGDRVSMQCAVPGFKLDFKVGAKQTQILLRRSAKMQDMARLDLDRGRFTIRVTEGDRCFALTVKDGEALYVEEGEGTREECWQARGFLELYLDHREEVEAGLFAALRRFKVPPPALPTDAEALRRLAAALLPPKAEDRAWAESSIAALDHDDPAVRSRVVEAMAERYGAVAGVVRERLASPGLSPQTRFALSWLASAYGSAIQRNFDQAKRGGLLGNSRFRQLLIEAAPKERRADLRRALDRVK